MTTYPFDEKSTCIDRTCFEVFSKYFKVADPPSDSQERKAYDKFGRWYFHWDGWETLDKLSYDDLCKLSPFLFVYHQYVFDRSGLSAQKLIEFMRKKGLTKEQYLACVGDFEFKALGPESTQITYTIAQDLSSQNLWFESTHAGSYFECFKQRFEKHSALLEQHNAGKENPCRLEKILTCDDEPVCLRYAPDGRLYVLDAKAVLHEFTSGEKTREWPLFIRRGIPSVNVMNLEHTCQTLPMIAVAQDTVFLTIGRHEVLRYNLNEDTYCNGKISSDKQHHAGTHLVHDVLIKDGTVFVSMSDEQAERHFIGLVCEKRGKTHVKEIYEGSFPRGFLKINWEDQTLRLGLHKGHLFFARGTGISMYQGQDQKPKEMLRQYARDEEEYEPVIPVTKFSFGEDFIVAQAQLKGFDIPMLCVFRPVYAMQEGGALTTHGSLPLPLGFELDYVTYPPKLTGITLLNTSLSAHENQFAMTHSFLKKVFVYSVFPSSQAHSGNPRKRLSLSQR